MKKRNFIASIFFLGLMANLASSMEQDYNSKISDHLYVEKRSTKNIAGKEDILYFAFEKIIKENTDFWENFAKVAHQASRNRLSASQVSIPLNDGTLPFLDIIENPSREYDVWVAYVTNSKIEDYGYKTFQTLEENPYQQTPRWYNKSAFDGIEMTFAVIVNPEMPFSTHMGISRSYATAEFMKSIKEETIKLGDESFDDIAQFIHPKISTILHSFAAKIVSEKLNETQKVKKEYMVTRPAPLMAKILHKAMMAKNLQEAISIGSNRERNHLKENRNHLQKEQNPPNDSEGKLAAQKTKLLASKKRMEEEWSLFFPQKKDEEKESSLIIPENYKKDEWSIILKSGEKLHFSASYPLLRAMEFVVSYWTIIDLESLGNLYEWNLDS